MDAADLRLHPLEQLMTYEDTELYFIKSINESGIETSTSSVGDGTCRTVSIHAKYSSTG